MKQVGCPVDHLPASPIARTPRARHLGEWRPQGSPPPNGRNSETGVEDQERASSRASSPSQQHAGYSTPLFQGSQSQIHNNSSLPFNSLRKSPVLSFLPPSLARFHQSSPWWHTYASPLFHHCVARLDHAPIRARIRQALASLHKLRAPGSADASFATTRQRTTQSRVGRPASKRSRFKTNEDGREASSPHRPRCG